ncbi:MAG: gliding motility-associated protein GldE [Cyclobacteriaceae bacterium]
MEPDPGEPLTASLLLATQLPFYIFSGSFFIVLLLLSGLISGSEVAFFSLSQEEIARCKGSSNPSEKSIAALLLHPQKLLATILVLNNLINISIVTLSAFVTWQITGTTTPEGTVIVLLSVIITGFIVYFGEIIPKVYANQNRIQFARLSSALIAVSYRLLSPLTWFLIGIGNIIEKRIERKGYNISVEELNEALELTAEKEATDEEKGILKGIVNFGTLSVKQVMKSRVDITAFDRETDFHELMDQINKRGYSRLPIYNETVDKIEGILYIKDLLPHLEKEDDFSWQSLLRPAFFVPESKKIDSLFKDFQEKHVHMAIVVDEYNDTSGLVTLEDIIEEIVGEINDEFDEENEIAYNKLDSNTYIFEGKTSLNDFCKIIEDDISLFEEVKGESESLGGLLLEINSKLPHAGDKIKFNRFVFTVVAVDQRRIKRVRVFVSPHSKELQSDFTD